MSRYKRTIEDYSKRDIQCFLAGLAGGTSAPNPNDARALGRWLAERFAFTDGTPSREMFEALLEAFTAAGGKPT